LVALTVLSGTSHHESMDDGAAKRNLLYFVDALIEYGWHQKDCPMRRKADAGEKCHCGFSDALAEAQEIKRVLEAKRT
jgi:hypothetical protein